MDCALVHLTMAILLANALSTLTLTGLIWFVQVVHYPLFAEVGRANFQAYEREHRRRTGWVVGAPILIELVTSAALVVRPPPGVPGALTWVGLALAVAIMASTALVQGPAHARLEQAWSDALHRRLVRTNWFRTAAWSARAVLVLGMVAATIRS